VHAEAAVHLNRTVQMIREGGAQPGVVLNPATPLSSVEWILEDVDLVLIMSVNPGFGGQKFIPNSLDKIRALKEKIQEKSLKTLIEIDGGVCEDNINDISEAGTDVFVAGSAIFNSGDYRQTIKNFRDRIKKKQN
jgi:ribulose-phosphate 3-epimerase